MKNKKMKIAMVASIVAIAGVGVFQSQQKNVEMDELVLANVEALARYELPEVDVNCGSTGGTCWIENGDCWVNAFVHYEDCMFDVHTWTSCTSPCLYYN